MKPYTVQASWNGYRINSITVDAVLPVMPPPNAPDNHRAILMAQMWQYLASIGQPGCWWLTCDIALDPDDTAAMHEAIGLAPELVHTGLVKLWPTSTGRDDWMWSHRGGTIGSPAATQDESAPVAYFSIDCVWTPARLLEQAFPAGQSWAWNYIDVALSELALGMGIGARVVPGCRPKHLHFTRENSADVITRTPHPDAAGY